MFVGAVGQDQGGEGAEMELTRWGVKACLTVKDQVSTGTILVLLDEKGERTMVTDRGANLLLEPSDFPPDFFYQTHHLHVTGYSFFGGLELLNTTMWALRQAGKQELAVSVDPSSYALLQSFGPARFLQMTQGADFVFPNLVEGHVLSGERDPRMIVRFLLDYYECVVLTLGAEGCLCGTTSGLHKVPGRMVHVEDTTGAGDAFAAGFLREFYENGNLLKALILVMRQRVSVFSISELDRSSS